MLSFPAPSGAVQALIATGKFVQATQLYQEEATCTLLDGRHVRLKRLPCFRTVRMMRTGFPAMRVVLETGTFEDAALLAPRRAARKAADDAKYERFHHFCAEDGHNGTVVELGSCCMCRGSERIVTVHYAPDAMGYPTPVLNTCAPCDGQTTALAVC